MWRHSPSALAPVTLPAHLLGTQFSQLNAGVFRILTLWKRTWPVVSNITSVLWKGVLHWEWGSRLCNPLTGFGPQGRRLRVVSFVRINSSSEVCFIRSLGSTHFLFVCRNLFYLTLWFSWKGSMCCTGSLFGCADTQDRWFSGYPMAYTLCLNNSLCFKPWTDVSWLIHLGKWNFSLCDWPWHSVWNGLDALWLS